MASKILKNMLKEHKKEPFTLLQMNKGLRKKWAPLSPNLWIKEAEI